MRGFLFPLWLVAFYICWLAIVLAGDSWPVVASHWPIAVAMVLGSYVAGSTPMGGGTIGFPVLVLLFGFPTSLGRDFSFAVQSIGMTSASIYILATGRPLAWRMLGWAMLGSLLGTPLGLVWVAPQLSGAFIKMLFAVIWAAFGVMTLAKLGEISASHTATRTSPAFDRNAGLAIGVLGGAFVASTTGVGLNMLIYAVLVLIVHTDLKVAIPTSVVLMAGTSLVGISTQALTGSLHPETYGNWLAAAPVAALSAPLGAQVVQMIGRKPTLAFVSVLCLLQFLWVCYEQWAQAGWVSLLLGMGGLLIFNLGFHQMYAYGKRLLRDAGQTEGEALIEDRGETTV